MIKLNFFAFINLISLIILMSEVIANMIINPNLGYNEVSPSHLGIYQRAAVSTDANQCASVGREILETNGNAVDAAIAMILCTGVVLPQSSGLGGGFFLNFYNRTAKKAYIIDARETAPNNSDVNMFRDNSILSEEGGLSIAIPGELAGLEEAHRRFGKLPWKRLFEGAINLAKNGFSVTKHLDHALQNKQTFDSIKRFPDLREYLTNKKTGDFYREGEIMKRPEYAKTLEIIANKGSKEFYSGELTKTLLADIRRNGGVITLDDFANYRAIIRQPIKLSLRNGETLLTAPPPASGGLLAFILNVMNGYRNLNAEELANSLNNTVTYYHRYMEALKFSFAKRSLMGDPDYDNVTEFMRDVVSKEYAHYIRSKIIDNKTYSDPKYYGTEEVANSDHGTVHTTVVDQYGNAVSIGSTINLYFGSKVMSPKTGVIFNNQMADFSSPGITTTYGIPSSKANRIKPGKRPVSSKSSAIVIDNSGDVRLTIGGSGGTHMISGIAATIMRTLWLQDSIKDAIDAPRIHHQLFPNVIVHEHTFPQVILRNLRSFGHRTIRLEGIETRGFDPKESITLDPRLTGSITLGIIRGYDGLLYANSDWRKEGTVDGF